MSSLDGQSILITGAARGIGAETARHLASRGAKVSLVGLEPEQLAATAQQCGPQAVWFEADITDVEALERAVAETVERLGGIDAVVANAGLAGFGPVRTIDPAAFERTIEVNLIGTWRTVRAALEPIIDRRGYVLVVASVAAAAHPPGLSAYAASKAGVEAFADSLRWEMADLGVDVGVGYFSWLGTEMVTASEDHPSFLALRSGLPGPLGKVYPVAHAAKAIARGIERRSDKVVAPRWVRAELVARGLVNALSGRDMRKLAPEIVRHWDAEAERRGAADASVPDYEGAHAGFEAADR
jgi:NAD(P)-dependent dehydrogenase (short-subunit alcohol dehydrogenase family)